MGTKIATYTKALLLLVVLMGFTACEDDETIYDQIVGRSWIGDLGFYDKYDVELESCVFFNSNGFGEDTQCYYDTGEFLPPVLPVRWWLDDGTMYMDYGRDFNMRELRYVDVSGRYLTGTLYIGGKRYNTVTLEMYD